MSYENRFEPRADLVRKLKKATRAVAGFDLYDVRWDTGGFRELEGKSHEVPGRDCLCIFEKDRRGNETVRCELREPPTDPLAMEKFEYPAPDGSDEPWETMVPITPEHPDYVEKVLGKPRQINEADVQEAIVGARYAVKRAMEINEKLKKQKEEVAKESARIRDEYTAEAAKEIARLMWQERTGKNAFVDLGARSEAGTGSSSGFTVNDRRRVK